MIQHVVKVYYKYPQNICLRVFAHRCKLIAWIKAIWFTKFGWRFFTFDYYKKGFTMDFEEFEQEVLDFATKQCPTEWRRGQAVFNYIEQKYHVGRHIQFEDHVDCFYNDNNIDSFIIAAYKRLCGGL